MADRPRITVVNDNPEFLDLMGDVLEDERYPTTLIDGDREGALDAIVASEPDLLIIDLRLGSDGLHGWNIVQGVRDTPALRELPILVCSADLTGMAAAEKELGGGPHFAAIRKPFDLDEITGAIGQLLRAAQPA